MGGSRRGGASDEGNEGHESHEGHEEAQGSRRGGSSDEGHEGYESHEGNEEGHEGYEGRESDESNGEGDEGYEGRESDEGNEEVRACSCEHGVRRDQRSGCGIWARVIEGSVRREVHRGSAVVSVSGWTLQP